MSEWQTIETAPKDGTPVLVWAPGARGGVEGQFHSREDPGVVVAAYNNVGQGWRGDLVEFESGWESTGSYTITIDLHPTHWLPLPEPPATNEALAPRGRN